MTKDRPGRADNSSCRTSTRPEGQHPDPNVAAEYRRLRALESVPTFKRKQAPGSGDLRDFKYDPERQPRTQQDVDALVERFNRGEEAGP